MARLWYYHSYLGEVTTMFVLSLGHGGHGKPLETVQSDGIGVNHPKRAKQTKKRIPFGCYGIYCRYVFLIVGTYGVDGK